MRAAILVVLLAGCDWVLSLNGFNHDAAVTEGWLHVAAGQYFTCAIDLHGTLYCWGYNGDRELGTGVGVSESDVPALVAGATWSAVTAGNEHACGLQTDGSLWCWGSNWTGQIGDGTMTQAPAPIRIGSGTYKAVDTRGNHTCAIDSADQLWCWGLNGNGQVGAGDTAVEHDSPVQITVDGPWLAVSAGQSHTCAITQAHALYCWGADYSGQVGNNDSMNVTAPVLIPDSWQAIELGENFSCGLGMDGRVRCWGDNTNNQLGDGTSADFHTPHAVLTMDSDFAAIAAGNTHACALHADRSLACWGDATPGPLAEHATQPTPVDNGPKAWLELSFAQTHGCGIDTQSRLWCVGDGTSGALGNGEHGPHEPVKIIADIASIEAGGDSTCAIANSGDLLCWGANDFAQLGDGTRTRKLAPNRAMNPSFAMWTSVSVGLRHACALSSAHDAYCWGFRGLGAGAATTNFVPTPTSINPGFTAVAAGGDHTCAIDGASKFTFCWGENTKGELGVDDTNVRTVPMATTGNKMFKAVATGSDFTCALDNNGRLSCTGNDDHGQCAMGTLAPYYADFFGSPDATQYASVFAGDTHACAITASGAAACWGRGYYGLLGNRMSIGAIRSPASVTIGSSWSQLALGSNWSCGLHVDGTTQCWGRNDYGQLGNNSIDDSMEPVAATPLGDTAKAIVAGTDHVCALTLANDVWCWGNNHDGQLGNDVGWVHTFVEVHAPS